MLLVPAVKSQSSLEKLGELYSKEVDFSNIIVIDKYKAQMSKFLPRDKEAFEEYAIRVAVITLKHFLSLSQFNMRIKQIGLLLRIANATVSSLSRNSVFE
jgi:hypothetical protein